MRSLEALQQSIQDRMHSLKYKVTPEEQKLLGITPDDLASFSDVSLMHTPQEIVEAIEEIIMEAYKTSPGFRKIFEEDIADDPSMMAETSQVVGGLLQHLRGVLPPESRTFIKPDTYGQAQDIVRDVLIKRRTPEAPVAVQEEKIAPITDAELSYFGLKPSQITASTRWRDIKNNVLYFLGKLKGADGKTIKNETTKGMLDDLKIEIMSKLLYDIKSKKIEAGVKLQPSDVHLLGKDTSDLKQIARSMVVRTKGKDDPIYTNDLMSVNSDAGHVLDLIERVTEVFNDPKFGKIIDKMSEAIDKALPPVNLFQNKLQYIKDEIDTLGLSKSQASALMSVNMNTLTYIDPVKNLLEDQKVSLSEVNKAIKDKGETDDLKLKKDTIQAQIDQLQAIESKDTTALTKAVEGFLDMLREYKDRIKETLTMKEIGDTDIISEFEGLVNDLALRFSSLSKENMFKARWKDRTGYMVKNLSPSSPAPVQSKQAAQMGKGYSSKLEDFRGKGLIDSYQTIKDIIQDKDKLPAIRAKLILILNYTDKDLRSFSERMPEVNKLLNSGESLDTIKKGIMELLKDQIYKAVSGRDISKIIAEKPDIKSLKEFIYNKESIVNKLTHVPSRQYGNVSTEDIGLDSAIKMISKLRSATKQLDFGDKGSEALELLSWMSDLGYHFQAPKKKAPSVKKACTSDRIRKIAMMILGADAPKNVGVHGKEGPRSYGPGGFGAKPDRYQNPAGVGSDRPYPTTGKAEAILHRSRQTKMGKKALKSVFAEPTFVPVLVEEMEKAGLNKGVLEGGKMPPVDIDKALEAALSRVTGKKDTLENILPSKLQQAYKAESYDLPRIQKDLDEAIKRRADLSKKIYQVERQYIPRLESFALFIENPIRGVQEKMDKGLVGEPEEKDKKEDILWMKDEVKPHNITPENFQKVLGDLVYKYQVSLPERSKEAATAVEDIPKRTVKKIVHTDLSKKLPTEFFKQYQVWKKILKDLKRGVDATKDAYKRSVALEKYYTYMMKIIRDINGFFGYHDDVMSADHQTIENLESFLKSPESKNIVDRDRALSKINALKKSFERQNRVYQNLKKAHPNLNTVENLTEESLLEIRSDIKDKDVSTLREVVVSPELTPSKDKARGIKERAREHEKGLSYIIDRSTYKNNMNKIMEYKPKKEKIEWPDDPSHPTFLPPERKKELEENVQKAKQMAEQFEKRIDYQHKVLILRRLEEKLSKISEIKQEVNRRIVSFEEAISRVPWDEMVKNYSYLSSQQKSKLTPEQVSKFKKELEILNSRVPDMFENIKDMQKKISEAKKAAEKNKAEVEDPLKELREVYEKEMEKLKSVKVSPAEIDPKVVQEQQKLEKQISELKTELSQTYPPEETKIHLRNLMQLFYRIRGMDKEKPFSPKTPEQKLMLLQEKMRLLEGLKSLDIKVAPDTEEQNIYQKLKTEVDQQLYVTSEDIKNLKSSTPMLKTAAIEDKGPDLSPYERALEERGKEPPPFIKEIKKPKGWEFVEEFFNNVKREHRFLRDESKTKGTSIRSDFLERRLSNLEQMAKAIDSYKKQLIAIDWKAPDPDNPEKNIDYKELVPFEETMNKFEELLFEYQDLIRKYTNQANDTERRIADLQQHIRELKDLFDPATGEFKGLSPQKLKSLKNIFLRLLYRDLESYWGTNVGEQLSVFGERGTDWYNNVYHTFKEIAKSRSNRKMLGLINKYKKETRSEMDDIVHRTKAQELEDERDDLIKNLKEMGVDPEKSPRISEILKTLNTRIDTIKKQEKQIDNVFNFMGAASLVSMQSDFEEMLRKRIKELGKDVKQEAVEKGQESEDFQKDEDLAIQDVDLNDEANEEVDKAIDQVEETMPVLIDNAEEVAEAEKELEDLKGMREERFEPIPTENRQPSIEKKAYTKDHRDFNLRILYGPYMQKKIAEMISDEIR